MRIALPTPAAPGQPRLFCPRPHIGVSDARPYPNARGGEPGSCRDRAFTRRRYCRNRAGYPHHNLPGKTSTRSPDRHQPATIQTGRVDGVVRAPDVSTGGAHQKPQPALLAATIDWARRYVRNGERDSKPRRPGRRKLSATIARFCSSLQRSRRSMPLITSNCAIHRPLSTSTNTVI